MKLNIEHSLYPYQERDLINVIKSFKDNDKVLLQEPTGAGKTVIAAFFIKWYVHNYKKKVVFLCNRQELINQTMSSLVRIGITCEQVISSKKTFHHTADVYICMEQTLDNKLDTNPNFLKNVGVVMIDEAHYQNFVKHIKFFSDKKILGLTATPVINERETFFKCGVCDTEYKENTECCTYETMEWGRPKNMARFYDTIVTGAKIKELIEYGQLVPVSNFVIKSADLSKLKKDGSGDFTDKSQNETFGSDDVMFDVVRNYEEIAKGEKTIIFTPNTKINVSLQKKFSEKGYETRIIDSVNIDDKQRRESLKWFDEKPDGILINTNTLVAGFDNKEVQCVILDRAFSSISSYIQAVGRGGRCSQKIFKPFFKLIDLGGNFERFNSWDDDSVDWEDIFYNGIGATKPKKEIIDLVKICKNCGYMYSRTDKSCPECGDTPPVKIRDIKESDEVAEPIQEIPPPRGEQIFKYTMSKGENIHFAFKVLTNYIVDMFRFYRVSKELYEKTKNNGNLKKNVADKVRKCYFYLISQPEFKGDTNRKLSYVINKCLEKIEKYYANK